jgi:hypothetical protein
VSDDQRQHDDVREQGQDEDEIEQVREERLAAENRPDGAEVDNTDRTFDPEKGLFTDQDEYDDVEPKFVDDELPDNRTDDASDGDRSDGRPEDPAGGDE